MGIFKKVKESPSLPAAVISVKDVTSTAVKQVRAVTITMWPMDNTYTENTGTTYKLLKFWMVTKILIIIYFLKSMQVN